MINVTGEGLFEKREHVVASRVDLEQNNRYGMKNRPTSQYLGQGTQQDHYNRLRARIVDC